MTLKITIDIPEDELGKMLHNGRMSKEDFILHLCASTQEMENDLQKLCQGTVVTTEVFQ